MRIVCWIFATVVLITAPIGAGAVTETTTEAQASALLAKHKAFVGWQFGDGTFQTMRISGSVTDEKGKQTGTFVQLSKGLLFNDAYTNLKRGDVTDRIGFTGNLFWQSDYNGFTTPIYGDYSKFLASLTLLRSEGTSQLPATYIGPKTADGKPVEVVRVTLRNGDPIDLYVDPSTGAYVQAVIDPDGAYETTYHIKSYRDVLPGKKMVSAVTVDDDKSVSSYTKFEPNVVASDQDLHPPAPIATWTFGSGAPFPLTLTHTRMLVDATVNGVKGRFILDTGADAIVLDDRFADRAHADILNSSDNAYMLYGEVKTRARKIQTLTLGDSTLHNVVAFSQDFKKHDMGDIGDYDGLIGFDIFAGAIVKLNVYASTMAILDPATDLSAEKGLPVTVDLSQGIPTVPMTLNRTMPVNAELDTGSPGVIFFGPDLIKKYHFSVFGGCANIQTLALGPIVYTDESACEYGMPGNHMLLGFDFLKHFDFVFDYPHGRMFLSKNKN